MGIQVGSQWAWESTCANRCFVASGFPPKEGVEFFQAFPLSSHPTSIRLLRAFAIKQRLSLTSLDEEQTFLKSDTGAKMYLRLHSGCDFISQTRVQLKNSPYGLKHASHRCCQPFSTKLETSISSIFFLNIAS